MRAPRHIAAATLLSGLSFLTGCDAGAGADTAGGTEALGVGPSQLSQATGPVATSSLITKMIGASSKLTFQGVRRYEAHWTTQGQPQSLVYSENVASDGAGQFAVDPLDLIEPVLTPPDEAQFLVLQKVREGLFFRYRDLVVRDEASFQKNYVTHDLGGSVQVVGRTCAELSIQEKQGATRRYLLAVDLENGLVLRAREELLDGTLVSLSEFESLSLTPDLSSTVWHTPLNSEKPLDFDQMSAASDLGFTPSAPKQLPSGWNLHEFARVVDPTDGRPWAKYVYSDGLEMIFLVQAKPEIQHELDVGVQVPPYVTETVTASTIGLWTVLRGTLQGREIVAMGKVDRQVLADLIQSTL